MISAGLSTRQDGGHLVVALRGELDAVDAADAEAALAQAVAANPRVVADLAALEFLDCCGLGVLFRVRAQARKAGGDLLLAAPGQQVRQVLALTGMTGLFCVHASVDEAVHAAGWPRSGGAPGARLPRHGHRGADAWLPVIGRWPRLIIQCVAAPDPGGVTSTPGAGLAGHYLHHQSAGPGPQPRPRLVPRPRASPGIAALHPDRAGWMLRGACRGEDPELFFPIATMGPALAQVSSAKAVCRRCAVQADCLSYALITGADGIWGGTTREERWAGHPPPAAAPDLPACP